MDVPPNTPTPLSLLSRLPVSNTGLFVAFVLFVTLIVTNAVVTYRNTVQLRSDTASVEHTRDVLLAISELRVAAKAMETGHRGFLLTGDADYLRPYEEAFSRIEERIDYLAELTQFDPEHAGLAPALRKAIAEQIHVLSRSITLRREAGLDAALASLSKADGFDTMARIETILDLMKEREERLLAARTAKSRQMFSRARTTSLVSTAASVILFAAAVILMRKNIASRVHATGELSRQSEFLRTTLASIVEGIVIADADGRVTFMNPVAEEMCAIKAASAIGRPIAELLDLREDGAWTRVESALRGALRDGRAHRAPAPRFLFVPGREARSIEDTAAPLRDAHGAIVGAVLALRDVTGQRRTELRVAELLAAALRNSARQLEIAEASLTLNSAHSRESVFSVLREEARRILDAKEALVVENGSDQAPIASDLSAPLVGPDGTTIASVYLTGMRGNATNDATMLQQLAHVASVALENARLYDELRAGDRRKDEFLATLAHELRNPLAPMRNSVEILRSHSASESDRSAASDAIQRQVVLLVRLVDDLLDVSRISRGKVVLQRKRVELTDVVGQALEMSRPIIEASGHLLSVQLPPSGATLFVDPARLAQILSSLLNNAAKYTERGGKIWLSCNTSSTEVTISVRDDGIGIPPEILTNIFDMFWQHENALERAQGGLGIGLTLVRQLVDLHGGRIDVKSDGVGYGSEFIVRLPLETAEAAGIQRLEPGPRQEGRDDVPAPLRILVVDDNEDSAESLAILLRLQGHESRTAHDGVAALQVEEEFRPHLVLLDIGLPKIHGYDVARTLRSRRGEALSITAMTGFGQPDDFRRSREAGFDHHLVKPVDPAELSRVLVERSRSAGAA